MKFKVICSGVILCLIFGIKLYALEVPNASDLMDKMKSALDLEFKQEDAIKPAVVEYVASFQKIYDKANGDEKEMILPVRQLKMQLEEKLSKMFTFQQNQTWKTVRRDILGYEAVPGNQGLGGARESAKTPGDIASPQVNITANTTTTDENAGKTDGNAIKTVGIY